MGLIDLLALCRSALELAPSLQASVCEPDTRNFPGWSEQKMIYRIRRDMGRRMEREMDKWIEGWITKQVGGRGREEKGR